MSVDENWLKYLAEKDKNKELIKTIEILKNNEKILKERIKLLSLDHECI